MPIVARDDTALGAGRLVRLDAVIPSYPLSAEVRGQLERLNGTTSVAKAQHS